MTAGQLRSDGVRRERDTTDLPGAKNVADVSFTAPDGLPTPSKVSVASGPQPPPGRAQLRVFREAAHLDQTRVASAIGIKQAHMSNENDLVTAVATLRRDVERVASLVRPA